MTARALTGNHFNGIRMPFFRDEGPAQDIGHAEHYAGWIGGVGVNVQYGPVESRGEWVPEDVSAFHGCIDGPMTVWTSVSLDSAGIATPTSFSAECGLGRDFFTFDYGTVMGDEGSALKYHRFWWGMGAVDGARNPRWPEEPRISDVLFGADATNDFGPTGYMTGWLNQRSTPLCEGLSDHECRVRFRSSNEARLDTLPVFVRDVLDALELVCEGSKRARPIDCDEDPIPAVSSPADLPEVQQHLECAAHAIESRAARTVFANLPVRVADALREESAIGSYPAAAGSYGANVARLRGVGSRAVS